MNDDSTRRRNGNDVNHRNRWQIGVVFILILSIAIAFVVSKTNNAVVVTSTIAPDQDNNNSFSSVYFALQRGESLQLLAEARDSDAALLTRAHDLFVRAYRVALVTNRSDDAAHARAAAADTALLRDAAPTRCATSFRSRRGSSAHLFVRFVRRCAGRCPRHRGRACVHAAGRRSWLGGSTLLIVDDRLTMTTTMFMPRRSSCSWLVPSSRAIARSRSSPSRTSTPRSPRADCRSSAPCRHTRRTRVHGRRRQSAVCGVALVQSRRAQRGARRRRRRSARARARHAGADVSGAVCAAQQRRRRRRESHRRRHCSDTSARCWRSSSPCSCRRCCAPSSGSTRPRSIRMPI
jgi:hypothetical protein